MEGHRGLAMKGQIKIGCLVLVLPNPIVQDEWSNAICRVVDGPSYLAPGESVVVHSRYRTLPYWNVEAVDGISRDTHTVNGVSRNSKTWLPEPHLMPLDPPDDIRREVRDE